MFSGKCKSCYLKEIEIKERNQRSKKEMKAIKEIINYIKLSNESKEPHLDWHQEDKFAPEQLVVKAKEYLKLKRSKQRISYFNKENVIKKVINKDYNIEKAINELVSDELIKIESNKILERQEKRKIREEAEKKIYGKVKAKRKFLTNDEKEMVFGKFNNECAVCGKTEGLHIHHKDEDSSNNQVNNLVVLCGVCHKKTHMKIR
jgi:5-methylcytosine-specific restriction endonuclease McrA